jgi:hypothetical protein
MTDGIAPKAPGPVRGRPFEKGPSGNPLGRLVGCRNKTAIAAAALLASEAEALTPQGGRAGARRRPRRRCGCASNASCRGAPPRDKARGLKARVKQGEQGCKTGARGWPGAGRVIPPAPRTPQSARMASARTGCTTHGRGLAADLLQIAGRAIIDSIHNCKTPVRPLQGERVVGAAASLREIASPGTTGQGRRPGSRCQQTRNPRWTVARH